MATDLDYQRLRLDLGLAPDDTDSLSDADAEAIFVEVGETYTDAASIKAASRVLAIDRLLIQAASDVDYSQNEASEKASQRHAQLSKERDKWQERLQLAISASGAGAVRSGRTTRKPARVIEVPDWGW